MSQSRNNIFILFGFFLLSIVTFPIRLFGLLVGVLIWQPFKDGLGSSAIIEKWRMSDD